MMSKANLMRDLECSSARLELLRLPVELDSFYFTERYAMMQDVNERTTEMVGRGHHVDEV
jgi:hypothetical protein